jgi:F0F1-type ATP synthase epsilon subunit
VLVRLADKPEDIDVAREQAAKLAAENELRQAGTLEAAERARVAMLTSLMKLRAAERARIKRGV